MENIQYAIQFQYILSTSIINITINLEELIILKIFTFSKNLDSVGIEIQIRNKNYTSLKITFLQNYISNDNRDRKN